MQNEAGKKELEFTLLGEKHEGYMIEWATHPSQSDPGKWMGSFHAFKEGCPTIRMAIGNLYDNPAAAQNEAIRAAKRAVDEAAGAA